MPGNNLLKPMPLAQAIAQIILPAYALLPAKMNSPEATVMMLTIFQQEGEARYRLQVPNGPAKGFWQFEKNGGVLGVMTHASSKKIAEQVCLARGIDWNREAIYNALEYDDILAACFARLLLYTDPWQLPNVDDYIDSFKPEESLSWRYYDRNWQPGKPHPEKWMANHNKARLAVEA
jgi:hypothetical protein